MKPLFDAHFLCTDLFLVKRKVRKQKSTLNVTTFADPHAEPEIHMTKSEDIFILIKLTSSGKTIKIPTEVILADVFLRLKEKIGLDPKKTYPKNKKEAKQFLTEYVMNGNMTNFLDQFEE